MLGGPGVSPAGSSLRKPDRGAALERAVAALVTISIVAIAAGSAWSPSVKSAASELRWAALLALTVAAAALARESAGALPLTMAERTGARLASALLALCAVSVAWSVQPRLTAERATSLAALLLAAGAIAFSVGRRPGFGDLVLKSILAAVALLLAASILLLLANAPASVQSVIPRFRGVEENPDTLPLLAAYALPLAVWLYSETDRRFQRIAATTVFVLVFVLLGASGSRGALLAGVAGLLVVVWALAGTRRRAIAVAAVVLVTFAGTLLITPLVAHLRQAPLRHHHRQGPAPATTKEAEKGSVAPAESAPRVPGPSSYDYPNALDEEVGYSTVKPVVGVPTHQLLSSSGRIGAWIGAIEQGNQRPLLGYGFGTEDHVFVDRYYNFESLRAENSWIGLYLQLGIAGVILLAALLAWALISGLRGVRDGPPERRLRTAACVGVVVSGCVEMVVQSFAYSAGDIATLSFWICAALLLVARVPKCTPGAVGT